MKDFRDYLIAILFVICGVLLYEVYKPVKNHLNVENLTVDRIRLYGDKSETTISNRGIFFNNEHGFRGERNYSSLNSESLQFGKDYYRGSEIKTRAILGKSKEGNGMIELYNNNEQVTFRK